MTIHLELREDQAERLDRFALGVRKSLEEATAQLLEEALRHAEYPSIEFRDSAVGRQAFLVGSGLSVWEVLMIADGYGSNPADTANHLKLAPEQVAEALRYASVFQSEVRGALDENRSITAEAIRAAFPKAAWIDAP